MVRTHFLIMCCLISGAIFCAEKPLAVSAQTVLPTTVEIEIARKLTASAESTKSVEPSKKQSEVKQPVVKIPVYDAATITAKLGNVGGYFD